jgi:hypothetical protein
MSTPEALASSPKTFLDRDNWMRAVLVADLPDAAVRVAMTIALHLRVSTGRCDPAYATLASCSRISERSVYRLVALLEHAGWIAIQRTRGRHSNQYILTNPAKTQAGLSATNPDTSDRVNPDTSDNPTLPNRASNPANMLADKKRRTAKGTTKGRESDSTPPIASRDLKRSPAKKTKASADRPESQTDDDSFREFWSVFPRRVAKEAAAKAYAAAKKRGATDEALLDGAKRYARERAGQEPRYTKHPSTWLHDGCWEDEAPPGAVIDENGNVVAIEHSEPTEDTDDVYERCEQMALVAYGGKPW